MNYYISILTIFFCSLFYDSCNCTKGDTHPEFSYNMYDKKIGPLNWSKKFPKCGGKQQSPINIDFNNMDMLIEDDFNSLHINNYRVTPEKIIITNNGHTVKYQFIWSKKIPSISGGRLHKEIYIFADLHVHWGNGPRNGSEHTINNKRYDAEFQLVFYNLKYGSLDAAKKKKDGLVVLGVFGEIFDVPSRLHRQYSELSKIKLPNQSEKLPKPLSLFDIFGTEILRKYYTYNGSLTTPPCYESVNWIVSSIPIKITMQQLTAYQHLQSKHGNLNSNVRPVQKLNNRTVYVVFNS